MEKVKIKTFIYVKAAIPSIIITLVEFLKENSL